MIALHRNPGHWSNQGNEIDSHAPPVRLQAVLAASPSCRGVRIPIIDGRVQRDWKDPCDEIGKNRIELSNGTSVSDGATVTH